MSCRACVERPPCPSPLQMFSELVGDHWWSGWPGAYCMKCGAEDPLEICLADGCACVKCGEAMTPDDTDFKCECCGWLYPPPLPVN